VLAQSVVRLGGDRTLYTAEVEVRRRASAENDSSNSLAACGAACGRCSCQAHHSRICGCVTPTRQTADPKLKKPCCGGEEENKTAAISAPLRSPDNARLIPALQEQRQATEVAGTASITWVRTILPLVYVALTYLTALTLCYWRGSEHDLLTLYGGVCKCILQTPKTTVLRFYEKFANK
jgi:hypothetical protein